MNKMRLIKNKTAASEAFNLFVPILLFMLIAFTFIFLFSIVKNSYEGDDLLKEVKGLSQSTVSSDIDFSSLLKTQFQYKSHKDSNPNPIYNISLYEIIYYGLENRYDNEIKNVLKQKGTQWYIIKYKGNECKGRSDYLSRILSDYTDTDDIIYSTIIINGKCVAYKYYKYTPDPNQYGSMM